MRLLCTAILATLLSTTTFPAGARTHTRYLELINRAHDSVTSLAIAPAGSDAYREMPLGAPLRGGGDSTTVELAAESCLHDLRFVFRNGRTLIYESVDICRHPRVHIRRLPLMDESGQVRLGQTPARDADRHTP